MGNATVISPQPRSIEAILCTTQIWEVKSRAIHLTYGLTALLNDATFRRITSEVREGAAEDTVQWNAGLTNLIVEYDSPSVVSLPPEGECKAFAQPMRKKVRRMACLGERLKQEGGRRHGCHVAKHLGAI